LRKEFGLTENDGIRYWWTNLYSENVFVDHFYCRPEPTLSPKNFFPGMIIWATHSVFQNDRRATPGDRHITFTEDVPVYTKSRPMVVLYSTLSGLYCAPMFSLSGNTRKHGWDNQREYEYISLAEEGDDWEGDTPWIGVLKFRPDPRRRRPLKSQTFISLAKPMYVDAQEYLETDFGYLPGDMYNRLMIALDFYQEKRKRDAFAYFEEEYENRGTKLTEGGLVGAKEKAKVEIQNGRMCHLRPTRDNSRKTWSLEGRKVRELINHKPKVADHERLQSLPVPEIGGTLEY
jgi:hypothetical protein